jgi:ketosteroid isomerase-like protein
MSERNVEIVRRGIELLNAGDWEAVFALYHPQVEYRDLQHGPDMPEVLDGLDGIRQVAAMWMEVYDEFGAEVYEYIDADPWVICDTRWYGKSKDSEVPVDVRVADAYQLQDGKIRRAIMSYADMASALAAARAAG